MGVRGGSASGTEVIIMLRCRSGGSARGGGGTPGETALKERGFELLRDQSRCRVLVAETEPRSILLSRDSPSPPSISSSHSSYRRVSLFEQPGQQRSTFHVRAANSLESAQELRPRTRPTSSPAADAGRHRGQRRSLPTFDGIAVKSPEPEPDGEHGTRLKHSTHPAEHVTRVNDSVAAASAAETPHSHRIAPHTAHTMHAGPAVAACAALVDGRQGQRAGPADARATGIDV